MAQRMRAFDWAAYSRLGPPETGMTGAQVAHIARDQHPDLSILFMSGYSDGDAIAVAVGQDAVLLRKPFDIHAVHECLQLTMRNRRAGLSRRSTDC